MKLVLVILLCLAGLASAQTIELYYTEDGKTVKSIRGYYINKDLTLVPEGDQSWLVLLGQQIGPNGYMVKQSKLTLGTLGKTKPEFIPMTADFLGFGHGRRFERAVSFRDIAYIYPDPKPFEPLHVVLFDGSKGELFVNGEYTESIGEKMVAGKKSSDIVIIHLKYEVPKSRRTPTTMPKQYGVRAKAISFSEQGLRKALRRMRF